MTRYGRRAVALAVALSALAGYVDALGFLSAGNYFVSFMSGNSTRLGIGSARATWTFALLAFGLVVAFVTGVVIGTLANRASGPLRRPAVLAIVTLCLAVSAVLHLSGHPHLGLAAMSLAMGAENAVLYREGEASVGLTYMTGTLVRLGQHVAAIAHGGPHGAWIPYAMLWVGMVVGAAAGALAYSAMGISGLWIAVGAAITLAGGCFYSARRPAAA